MLTISSIVSVFDDKREIIPKLIHILHAKGILHTELSSDKINLLALSDKQFEIALDTDLMRMIVREGRTKDYTRLYILYDTVRDSAEAIDYYKKYSNTFPSDTWSEIMSNLSKKDITSLSLASKQMQGVKAKVEQFHQYDKGGSFYGTYHLTRFQLEMIKNMLKNPGTLRWFIPDDENLYVISYVIALEIIKNGSKVLMLGFRKALSESILNKLTSEHRLINIENDEEVKRETDSLFISSSYDEYLDKMKFDFIISTKETRPPKNKPGLEINLGNPRGEYFEKLYAKEQVTPVWVTMSETLQTQGQTLYIRSDEKNRTGYVSALREIDKGKDVLDYDDIISWDLLKHFYTIVYHITFRDDDESMINQIYSLLSQFSSYPRRLVIRRGKQTSIKSGYSFVSPSFDKTAPIIPIPRSMKKYVKWLVEEELGKTTESKRPALCGLSYIELYAAIYVDSYFENEGVDINSVIENILKKGPNKRILEYKPNVDKNNRLRSKELKMVRLDDPDVKSCWFLIDPQQKVYEKPITQAIEMYKQYDELDQLKIEDLKKILRNKGLSTAGKKADLINRIKASKEK